MKYPALSGEYQKLISVAKEHLPTDDPAHDRGHISRVLNNALAISEHEGGDLEVIVPAALFHDVVNYAKNDARAALATDESAAFAAKILDTLDWYQKEKISQVEYCIKHCSFSKNLPHDTLESKILQDADFLESVGAISLMRTFTSGGKMNRPFFDEADPFALHRETDPRKFSFDLVFHRLLKVKEKMLTETGKKMAEQRHEFLHVFADQVKKELRID